ncbi:unnamed protein product [Ilex paraguariensis]|uniref:Uncharacterized protein n=1 Tax=Ilex paraguariensis TaxID=185542 RepID=A0ABC8UTD4_9AQUA
MASSTAEIVHECLPFIQVYKDGRVQRLVGNDVVPASVDPDSGVQSQDIGITMEIVNDYAPCQGRDIDTISIFHHESPVITKLHQLCLAE